MKKKPFLIPLILGIILLAVGIGCFARVCAVKDAIYRNYQLSFSDASMESVFINEHDEATVKADFDAAVLATAQSAGTAAVEGAPVDEAPAEEGAAETADAETAEPAEAEPAEAAPAEEALEAAAE